MVRIEPKNPIPKIDFLQWDGLLRICFNRKNKLIAAIFKTKVVLKLLYANHIKGKQQKEQIKNKSNPNFKIFSENNDSTGKNLSKKKKKKRTRRQKNDEVKIDGIVEESMKGLEIEGSEDDTNNEQKYRHPPKSEIEFSKDELHKFKVYLMKVLKDNGFENERSSKMHWSRFLELLQILNMNDIYFK